MYVERGHPWRDLDHPAYTSGGEGRGHTAVGLRAPVERDTERDRASAARALERGCGMAARTQLAVGRSNIRRRDASLLLRIPHPRPLLRGRLVDRYERFIAEIELDSGERIRAHCVNPGRMEGLVAPGVRTWVWAVEPESKRKLRYTWELVEDHDGLIIGANTVVANRIAGELLAARVLPGLRRYRALRSEVAYGERSRVDFLLDGRRPHYVEVKNSHLRYPDGRGYFPDAVSARAKHHLLALREVVAGGAKATVLFVSQRPDVRAIRPSIVHDPEFASAAREVAAAGVRFRAVAVRATPEAYEVLREVPVDVSSYATDAHVRWREQGLLRSGWRRDPRRAV